ncbi:MAG: hypothetical protein EHM56_03490 [Chloroflexi bacterium]|nr:MAG: hypothetical protein EHM56_03490 [Chloroflexota bacterium]
MRDRKANRKSHFRPMAGALRMVSSVTIAVLVVGLLFGAGQVMADSLPGEPLYALKLLVTEQRMRWTNDPEARMDLALDAVGERLNEVAESIETGQTIDQSTNNMLQKHVGMALDTVDQEAQEPLQAMEQHQATIQNWHRRVVQAMAGLAETDREPLRELARETEQLRYELHAGKGEAAGEQNRGRLGEPKDPADMPLPADQPGLGPQAEQGSKPEDMPAGPGPKPEETPTGDEAPVSAGPGPGPQAPDETSGTGPSEEQPGPGGPADDGGKNDGGNDDSGGSQPDSGGSDGKGKP